MAKWGIKYGNTANYFKQVTGIGPAFGATRKTATTFPTKREAEQQICCFTTISMVMAKAVKLSG